MSNNGELEKEPENRSLDAWIEDIIARCNEVVYDVLTEINQVFDEVF